MNYVFYFGNFTKIESYSTWSLVTRFSHSNVLKVHPCCGKYVPVFHSFLLTNNIPLHEYTTLFPHSLLQKHLDYFYFLAGINTVYEHLCRSFYIDICFNSFWVYSTQVGFLGQMVTLLKF